MKLDSYSSERQAKEIAVHRVQGASVKHLTIFLNKDFIELVADAFIAAHPLGWYVMDKLLQGLADRTEISWWMCTISGVIALAIACITESWQTWRAATTNPREGLRYE